MAATTGQLGLVTPTQGDLSGTWGNTVNNGITEYTNIAIAGTTTFNGDGAVTLVNTTGDASATNIASTSAQYMIVRVTGTLTTAKIITFGSAGSAPYSKLYLVDNAATGGIVTFKAYGQTGVSVAVGEKALVFYNGTDIVKVSGTVATAGGSNTQVQYNSSGILAGSANLTFDGTNLGLAGGTANGVTYLNGSKVLTSGSVLQFDGTNLLVGTTTTLSPASGRTDVSVNGSSTSMISLGIAGARQGYFLAPSSGVTLASDTGTLNLTTTSGQAIVFNTNATERGRFDSSGNLGIGTSSPAFKLDISGGGTTAKFNTLDTYDGGASLSTWMKVGRRAGSGTNAYINTLHSGSDAVSALTWAFGTSGTGTEVMRLLSDGSLVLNNAGGDANMYFGGSSGTNRMYLARSGVNSLLVNVETSGALIFGTNGAERARISAAGGFSVGTTADPGAGAIYATGNITAYYSSDIKFKENVRNIPDALATVNAIGGKLFDWKDDYIESKGGADGYFVQKADFGVVAQDVQKVFPIAVRTREDGSLAVDYEKLGALAFAALVELTKRVEALEAK